MRSIVKFVILAFLVLAIVAAVDAAAKKGKAKAKAPSKPRKIAKARAPSKPRRIVKGKAPGRPLRVTGGPKKVSAVRAPKTDYNLQWTIANEIRTAMGGTLWEPMRGWRKDRRGCPTPTTCPKGSGTMHNGVMYSEGFVGCMAAAGYAIAPDTVCVSSEITWTQRPGTYLHEAFHLYMMRLVRNRWMPTTHEAVSQEGSYFNEGFTNALTMEYSLRRGGGKPWLHLSGVYGQWFYWTPLAKIVLDTWDPVNPQWNTPAPA
jgi:hypothetical protein